MLAGGRIQTLAPLKPFIHNNSWKNNIEKNIVIETYFDIRSHPKAIQFPCDFLLESKHSQENTCA